MLESRFYPAWRFGQCLLEKLQLLETGSQFGPHCSDVNSERVWREVWFGASPYIQGNMEVGKYSPKKHKATRSIWLQVEAHLGP